MTLNPVEAEYKKFLAEHPHVPISQKIEAFDRIADKWALIKGKSETKTAA